MWAAALGCLFHLTVAGGQPSKALLLGLPMQALALLLRRCIDFGWWVHTAQLAWVSVCCCGMSAC